MVYFPFAGLAIGLFLSGINKLFFALGFPSLAVDIILVVTLVAVTGGMHLDGLSDSADAFLSGKPKDKMLEIMRGKPHATISEEEIKKIQRWIDFLRSPMTMSP